MADQRMTPPPANMGGMGRMGRGAAVVKPKNMKGTLLQLWELTEGKRQGLGMILILSVLISGVSVLSPIVTGAIVTAIKSKEVITFFLCFLSFIYIADWLIRLLQQLLMASLSQRIIYHIRRVLFEKMKTLPLSFFDRHRHGELMSRLTNDIDSISTTISGSVTQLLTYTITIIGIFVMMLLLNPLLTMVTLLAVLLIFILTKIVTKRTRKLFSARQKNLGQLNGQVEESISGLAVVKAFCREAEMKEDFEEKNESLRKISVRALIWSGYLMPLMNVINNLCYLSIAVLSGILFVRKDIVDIGLITTFLLYARQFTRPFVEIANIYNNFQTAVAGAERVFEIIDETPEPEDTESSLPLKDPKGDIVFSHVSFGYDKEHPVLKDISLEIPAGTQVAIVGPTGSGKTTIINLLTRFYDVTEGVITLDGHDLRDYKMEALRDAFGVVLQDTALFADTVKNNIRYGHSDASMEQIKAAAKAAGAESFIERLPNGYDTVLEQGGQELSQGERQLLTIARAVLANAPIMILDEATSSVDTVTEQKIKRAMAAICKDRTSILIAHRLSTIRDADMILLIENGKIAEQGSHDRLMALNGKYAKMYRTQVGDLSGCQTR